jgi:hypothetical protein
VLGLIIQGAVTVLVGADVVIQNCYTLPCRGSSPWSVLDSEEVQVGGQLQKLHLIETQSRGCC